MKKIKKLLLGGLAILIGLFFALGNYKSVFGSAEETTTRTLHEQTKIYGSEELQEPGYPNGERYANYLNDLPTITVLTHGLEGDASHWSNTGEAEFAYNSHSLIAKIGNVLGNELTLYYAKGISATSFDLYKLSLTDYNTQNRKVSRIDDVSQHIVLVYQSWDNLAGNFDEYEAFEYVIDSISLQYKQLTGKLPRLNLVGHSRGGITNIMYATEHIYNVDAIYSMGTPYSGSVLGQIDYMFNLLTEASAGATDIMDPVKNKAIRNAWNTAFNASSANINIKAFGAMTSIGMVREFLNDCANDPDYADSISDAMDLLNFVVDVTESIPLFTDIILNFVEGVAAIANAFDLNAYDILLSQISDKLTGNITYEEGRQIINLVKVVSFELNNPDGFVIMDDLFIDTNSQLGYGFEDGEEYKGFKRYVKIFGADDYSENRSVPSQPAVVHNLETMNTVYTRIISTELRYGTMLDNVIQLQEDSSQAVSFKDGQAFSFTASFSGNRSITAIQANIELNVYNQYGCLAKLAEGNGTLNYELKEGQEYLIVISSSMPISTTFSISFIDIISLGENFVSFNASNKEVIKLSFSENYYYELTCLENGAVFQLYDEDLNELETLYSGSIRIENGGEKAVYVSISLPQTITKNVIVSCEKQRDVSFITYSNEEIPSYTAYNDEYNDLPNLLQRGYTFGGWWFNSYCSGEQTTIENLATSNQANVVLYAKWTPIIYTIFYIENGGIEIENDTYTIQQSVRLNSNVSRAGYIFKGWYNNPLFEGTPIEIIQQNNTGDLTFYAKWVQETYLVSFDLNAMQADDQVISLRLNGQDFLQSQKSVNYGQIFVLPIPSVKGFTFEGWYIENTQITTALGESLLSYLYESDLTVKAKWSRDSYTIKIVQDQVASQYKWLISGGISTTQAEIAYSVNLCPNCMVTELREGDLSILYREGYKYKCLKTANGDVACWTNLDVNLSDGAEYIIYASYEAEEYTITFVNHKAGTTVVKTYGFNQDIDLSAVQYGGYVFEGWFISGSNNTFEYLKMPDLTVNKEDNGGVTLEGKYSLISYDITYVLNEGEFKANTNIPEIYTVESVPFFLPIPDSTRQHFEFKGWYTSADFSGSVVERIQEYEIGNKTYYAKWERIKHNITYANLTFQGQTAVVIVDHMLYDYAPTTYEQGVGLSLKQITAFYQPESPYTPHLVFIGWYLDMNFSNKAENITQNDTSDFVFYAKWRYDFNSGGRIGNYTITDDTDRFGQPYDQFIIGLNTITYDGKTLYENLKSIGITHLYFKLKVELYEVNKGYQRIYVYGDLNGTIDISNGKRQISHMGSTLGKTSAVYTFLFEVNLDKVRNCNYVYVRYSAAGEDSDTWVTPQSYFEVSYGVETSDLIAEEFTWEYQDKYPNDEPEINNPNEHIIMN